MPVSSVVWCWSTCGSPVTFDGEVEQRVAGEEFEHMVEKADAGRDLGLAGAIEGDRHGESVSAVRRLTLASRIENILAVRRKTARSNKTPRRNATRVAFA